jgi:DNA-binding CsgD family transcriptional regulator
VPLLELHPRKVRLLELLEAGRSSREIAKEFATSHRTIEMHTASLMNKLDVHNIADLVAAWRRFHEPDRPDRIQVPEIGPQTSGTRRCMSPGCAYEGRWLRATMVPNQDGKFICVGCYSVYEPRDVIDPGNEDYQRYVR